MRGDGRTTQRDRTTGGSAEAEEEWKGNWLVWDTVRDGEGYVLWWRMF